MGPQTLKQTYNMNKTSHYRLTIIVPIYNEEDNIAALED